MCSSSRRVVAVFVFGLGGSVLAFGAGARVGARLDHQTRVVSIARMPIPVAQREVPAVASSEIARK